MSTDYYKDLWNNPKTEAGQFFNKVDFNHQDYKKQEDVLRYFLKGLNALKALYPNQKPIDTVLEVGAGTGRMTKIVVEELNPKYYGIWDLDIKKDGFPFKIASDIHQGDITTAAYRGDPPRGPDSYDLILASEVFMHIKPIDISITIQYLSMLLAPQGMIINIDWYYQPEPSTWCYIHDYEKMYREENGLHPVFEANINKQKLFCYGK